MFNPLLIPLVNQSLMVKVDREDYELLSRHKWYLSPKGYAIGKIDRKMLLMHRLILNPGNNQTDHINGDKLDNRKENLRMCTNAQNQMNKGLQSNNTSGYRGVYWNKARNRWGAVIKLNGKQKHLGQHRKIEEAALAYNKSAKELFGEFAYLNKIGGIL